MSEWCQVPPLSDTGEGSALPGGERLEQPEHPECVGGPLRSGPGPLGPLHRMVPVELHPADEGGGVRSQPARQPHRGG